MKSRAAAPQKNIFKPLMSPHASFLPPDVTPPDPLEAKVVALVFSMFMYVVLTVFIGYICVDFLADLFWHSTHQEASQEPHGPSLAEFLGFEETPFGNFELTEEEQERAIGRFQKMLQHTENVSVEIAGWNDHGTSEKYWLSWNNALATELCDHAEFFKDTFILSVRLIDAGLSVSEIVFTFYPSEVKINVQENTSHALFLSVTKGGDTVQWEGNFGDGFLAALLNSPLQEGGTVRTCISTCIPFFPLDSVPSPPDH